MKKILKYALMAVLAVAVVLPMASKVEAATVAVVPLIIDESVKDEEGMNSMLYSDAISKIVKFPEYDLVPDTDLVRQSALAQQEKLFTKEGMMAVAAATKADIVIAMSLDKFDWVENRYSRHDPITTLDFQGKIGVYNKLNGNFKFKNWTDNDSRESASISVREDWPHDEFGRFCRVTIKSMMKAATK